MTSYGLWKILGVTLAILFVHLCRGEENWPKRPTNVIIDTDAGGDDAVALLLALAVPWVNVVAITCTYGNTYVENVEQNVLKTLTIANRTDIPVYRGAQHPLYNETVTAYDYFGKDGFGDFKFGRPVKGRIDKSKNASVAMIDLVNQYEGDVSILTLGPLTNVASAMLLDPSFGQKVERFYMMGIKIMKVADQSPDMINYDFNFGADPESAQIFFNEPKKALPLVLPSDVVHNAEITKEWRNKVLGALHSLSVEFLNHVERVGLLKGSAKYKPADSMACAVMLLPELVIDKQKANYEPIVIHGDLYGNAYLHWTDKTPNAEIVRKVDVAGFKKTLLTLLA